MGCWRRVALLCSWGGFAHGAPQAVEGCVETVGTPAVTQALLESETAFAARDLPTFNAAIERAESALPCVSNVVVPALAARMHLVEGLRWFVTSTGEGDSSSSRAKTAFAAYRMLEGAETEPPALIPTDITHPLRQAFFAAPLNAAAAVPVPPVASQQGALRFDGAAVHARPTDRPTVFQRLDGSARVRSTVYLWPEDPLPAYPQAQSETVGLSPGRKAAWWLGGIGLASLATAGGAGGYYAYAFGVGDCSSDANGDLQCPTASTGDTTSYYDTFLRPSQVTAFIGLGVGGALVAASGVTFAVTGGETKSVSAGARW
jgi:hypothetical protein